MKECVIVLLFLMAFSSEAQKKIDSSFVIGTWEVKRIVKTDSKIDYNKLLLGLESAKYTFHKDRTCEISTSSSNRVFDMYSEFFKKATWKIDKNTILIRGKENNQKVADIQISFEGNKVFFIEGEIESSALIIEVIKE